MKQGREIIRKYTWTLLIIFILATILLFSLGSFLGTTNNLFGSYSLYITLIAMVISLIGLFMYKKWGLYIFTIYLIYNLITYIIALNLPSLILVLLIYGYFIWYKGFYKNIQDFD